MQRTSFQNLGMTVFAGTVAVLFCVLSSASYIAADDSKKISGKKVHQSKLELASNSEATNRRLELIELQKHSLPDRTKQRQSISITSDGKFVYSLSVHQRILLVFRRDQGSGKLSLVETMVPRKVSAEGLSNPVTVPISYRPIVMTVDRSAKCVYVAASQSVLVFDRDQQNGRLTIRQIVGRRRWQHAVGIYDPIHLALSADGKSLYLANKGGGSIMVFQREPSNGKLHFSSVFQGERVNADPTTLAVKISPDGRYLYAISPTNNYVAVFERDRNSGKLSLLKKTVDWKKQMGLLMVSAMAISPDGGHLYFGSLSAYRTISMFERNAETGMIEFGELLGGFQREIAGLHGISSIEVSPDGRQVFCAAGDDSAISIFDRDTKSGRLKYVHSFTGQEVQHVSDLVLSPNGKHLYAASANASAAVFKIVRPR